MLSAMFFLYSNGPLGNFVIVSVLGVLDIRRLMLQHYKDVMNKKSKYSCI